MFVAAYGPLGTVDLTFTHRTGSPLATRIIESMR
jgi:hypothetical protein